MREYLLIANGIGNDTDAISEFSIGTEMFRRHFVETIEEDMRENAPASEIEKAIMLAENILHSIETTNMQLYI